jgi:hypothetical protein
MARNPKPISEAKIGSKKEQAKGRAKVAAPVIPYVKVGKAAEDERKRAATRAETERVESNRAAEGRRSGFSVQELKRLADNPATGGGTVLPHSGVQGGLRMSDQMEPPAPTENKVTERVINRKPYSFRAVPIKNTPAAGVTPEQEAAQKKYIDDAMATPEGQAYKANWDAIRAKQDEENAARQADLNKTKFTY